MNAIFNACGSLLVMLAEALGMTYPAVNVWIFVMVWPVFTLLMIGMILRQRCQLKRLHRELRSRAGVENLERDA